MKTYSIKATDIKRAQHNIDAADKILGDVAVEAASLLMGKHKPMFSRNMDVGDIVVVTNADKIKVTGNKLGQKLYYRHSNYPGGFRKDSLEKMLQTHPTRVIEHAVKGMLPQNRLRDRMMRRLKVYTSSSPKLGKPKVSAAKTKTENVEAKQE